MAINLNDLNRINNESSRKFTKYLYFKPKAGKNTLRFLPVSPSLFPLGNGAPCRPVFHHWINLATAKYPLSCAKKDINGKDTYKDCPICAYRKELYKTKNDADAIIAKELGGHTAKYVANVVNLKDPTLSEEDLKELGNPEGVEVGDTKVQQYSFGIMVANGLGIAGNALRDKEANLPEDTTRIDSLEKGWVVNIEKIQKSKKEITYAVALNVGGHSSFEFLGDPEKTVSVLDDLNPISAEELEKADGKIRELHMPVATAMPELPDATPPTASQISSIAPDLMADLGITEMAEE